MVTINKIDLVNYPNEYFFKKVFSKERSELYYNAIEKIVKNFSFKSNATADVVVVSWKFSSLVHNLLIELKDQCLKNNSNLIFVNNGGGEELTLIGMKYSDLTVELKYNYGAYFSRNVGMSFGTGDIIIFIDDDCKVNSELVKSHVETHFTYDIISARGKILPLNENQFNRSAIFHYNPGELHFPIYVNTEGNSSYFSKAFIKAGGWDDTIKFGGGGIDLSIRLMKFYPEYHKQIYSPIPVIYHDYAISKTHLERKQIAQENSRIYLKWKHKNYDEFRSSWSRYKRDYLGIVYR